MYTKVNLGLFLEDKNYFDIILSLLRVRDRKRREAFKSQHSDNIYCDTCKGFGAIDSSGKPLSFPSTALEKIAIPTSDALIRDVAYLGKVGLPNIKKPFITYAAYLRQIKNGVIKKTPNFLITDQLFKSVSSIKKCPDCYGYGVKDIVSDPPLPISAYNVAIKKAIEYINRDKNTNLYNVTIGLDELYSLASSASTLALISKKDNKSQAVTTAQNLSSLRSNFVASYRKYLNKGKTPQETLQKYTRVATALRDRALDEIFARWILQKLRRTIRVDTGLSKRKLRANIKKIGKNSLHIYIMSARIKDRPENKGSNDSTIYISFYSDWGGKEKKDWSELYGIRSLKGYLHNEIVREFITQYDLGAFISAKSDIDLGKRLMKLITMFEEKYGGK